MTTNVPQPSLGPNGFVAPSEEAILAGVLADFQAAFGGNLNPDLTTPQGQLITSITAVIGYANDLFRYYTNQVDPAFASGRMQDAIGRLYYLTRDPAEPTVVSALLVGAAGVVIPAGTLAKATDGSIYAAVNTGTIPLSGQLTLTFANTTTGPIALAVGELSTIYQSIPGWDTITNPTEGVTGRDVESRAAFEARRAASVAFNALGTLPSIRASVLSVPNVLDAYVTENNTGSAITPDGVTIAAHSLYVAVVGGTDADVARAIWTKKNPGCAYNGNTTVTVTDNNSGYTSPPTYAVTFTRPSTLPLLFAVQIANSASVPSDAATQIQTAVVAAFNGADGGPRATIGATVYASRFYAATTALGPWAQIVSLQLGSPNSPDASVTAYIANTALTVTATAAGALAVGQTLLAPGVLPNTVILSGSGTSWIVSRSQTVTTRTMYSVVANLNDVPVHIDQIPTLDAGDVVVTLV